MYLSIISDNLATLSEFEIYYLDLFFGSSDSESVCFKSKMLLRTLKSLDSREKRVMVPYYPNISLISKRVLSIS